MTRRRAGLLHVPSQPILGLPMRAMPLSTGQGLPGQVWAREPSPAHQMLQTVPKYLFWGDLRVGHRQDLWEQRELRYSLGTDCPSGARVLGTQASAGRPRQSCLGTQPGVLGEGRGRGGSELGGPHTDHNSGDYGQQGVAEAEHAVGVLGPVGSVLVLCARGGVSLHAEGWLWGPGPGHGGAWKAAQV